MTTPPLPPRSIATRQSDGKGGPDLKSLSISDARGMIKLVLDVSMKTPAAGAPTAVSYGYWQDGWQSKEAVARTLAMRHERVCEVGAGASPLLSAREGYVLLDISATELAKAGDGYHSIVADLCSPEFSSDGGFDFVFSLSTAEHIRDPERFHRNIRLMLRPGGIALHFFPTLHATPFVANRLLPDAVSRRLLLAIHPSRIPEGKHAKFPAYYRWCLGPSSRQIRRLEQCGFSVECYSGYFGHGYYRRLGLQPVVDLTARWLVQHPIPALTSYALVVLIAD
jgi:SAM-dependent methyltransferase